MSDVEDVLGSHKEIAMAVGVLAELRGSSPSEALKEFIDAVHETGVGADDLGHALVALASGQQSPNRAEALHRWGHLLALRGRTATNDGRTVNTTVRVRYGPHNQSTMC